MSELKRCPCGRLPSAVEIYDANQGSKWAMVVGNCCGEWHIEFRTMYQKEGSAELRDLAVEAWNNAPRCFGVADDW